MRVTLIAFGSRGDVTPFVALAVGLRAAGCQVRLASHAEFAPLAAQYELDFRAIPGRYFDTADRRSRPGPWASAPLALLGLYAPFQDCAEAVFRECWEASADADAVACSALAAIVGGLIASARRLPLTIGSPFPATRSRFMPSPAFPAWPLGRIYNRFTNRMTQVLLRLGGARVFRGWHREARRLASSGLARPSVITLVAASPVLVPRPPDWPETTHVTGYWFLPPSVAPAVPEPVRDFVASGPPPLCFGFGSVPDYDPDRLRRLVLDTVARLKARAIVVSGSGGALSGLGRHDSVCETSFVDYDWLLRRVSVVVHHGSAGTSAFGAVAGIPQVTVPYLLDHWFWSSRLHRLGVAPPAVTRRRLTVDRLTAMVRAAVDDPAFRTAAQALAPRIAAEDGVGRAVALLRAHAARPVG